MTNELSSSLLLVKNTDFSSSSLHFSPSDPTDSKRNRISTAEISKSSTNSIHTHIDDLDIQLELPTNEQLNENYFNTRLKTDHDEKNSLKNQNNASVPFDLQLSNIENIDKQQKHKQNIQVINNYFFYFIFIFIFWLNQLNSLILFNQLETYIYINIYLCIFIYYNIYV